MDNWVSMNTDYNLYASADYYTSSSMKLAITNSGTWKSGYYSVMITSASGPYIVSAYITSSQATTLNNSTDVTVTAYTYGPGSWD